MLFLFLKNNFFLLCIIIVIYVAKLNPSIGSKGGLLHTEITVKYLAVGLIFLGSGLSLRTEELTSALTQWRLHIFIMSFTFLLFPLLMRAFVVVLDLTITFDTWILKGLLAVGSMPPPVSSAVLLSKSAGGNVAGAVFNSALGSFLGTFLSPMWLIYFLDIPAEVSTSAIFRELCSTVVFPLVVGQVIRAYYSLTLARLNIPFGDINSCLLLFIIYATFCDTFKSEDLVLGGLKLAGLILLVLLIQVAVLLAVFVWARRPFWNFTSRDVVSALFCSQHKSLTLGIPILKVMFSDHPSASTLCLPLLIYHPCQIILGSALVPYLRDWVSNSEKRARRRRHRSYSDDEKSLRDV